MYRPPSDPRNHPAFDHPGQQGILAGYVSVVAFFLALWIISHPLAGVAVLTAIVGSFIGVRRAVGLARCFHDCGGFSFDLGRRVRITITRPSTDGTD